MTEDQLEQETLAWLAELGYAKVSGYDIAHDGPNPQRADHRQVILPFRLREAIQRLNPHLPTAAREDALHQVQNLGLPALLSANRAFHKLLVNGVPVQYQNRSIETAQVMEELVEMAKKFREAASRGAELGLSDDEVRFYDALATNESAVKELTDETLKKIAHELTENLRKSITVDWAQRSSVRATLRLMVKRILRKYKYPPDLQDAAVELVLQQAQTLGESWANG